MSTVGVIHKLGEVLGSPKGKKKTLIGQRRRDWVWSREWNTESQGDYLLTLSQNNT